MLGPFTGQGGIAITPNDTVAQGTFRALYVGGVGDVTLVGLDGNTVLFQSVPVGTTLNVGCTIIKATGTTATKMVGIT